MPAGRNSIFLCVIVQADLLRTSEGVLPAGERGYTVTVDVDMTLGGQTFTGQTSFTPH